MLSSDTPKIICYNYGYSVDEYDVSGDEGSRVM